MQKRENALVEVINTGTLAEVEVDTATATGDLNIYPGDANAPHYVLTNNRSGAINVGINVRNARKGMVARVTVNSGTPGAQTVTVKSGTAAGGTTLGRAIAASRNGFVEAKFDGTDWICIGMAEVT
jgi:hypothetical protein